MNFLSASGVLFLISVALFALTFWYFHYAGENGLPGREYHEKPIKPFVSLLFGVLATVLLASSIICLVFALLSR